MDRCNMTFAVGLISQYSLFFVKVAFPIGNTAHDGDCSNWYLEAICSSHWLCLKHRITQLGVKSVRRWWLAFSAVVLHRMSHHFSIYRSLLPRPLWTEPYNESIQFIKNALLTTLNPAAHPQPRNIPDSRMSTSPTSPNSRFNFTHFWRTNLRRLPNPTATYVSPELIEMDDDELDRQQLNHFLARVCFNKYAQQKPLNADTDLSPWQKILSNATFWTRNYTAPIDDVLNAGGKILEVG